MDALLALECATWEEHLRATYELCQQTSDGFLTTETLAEILQVQSQKAQAPRHVMLQRVTCSTCMLCIAC